MLKYMKHRQKLLERKWEEEEKRIAEEAEEEAARVARMEAEARHKEFLIEQREDARLRRKHIQRKEKLAEEQWDKQHDALLAQIKARFKEDSRLEEIRVIIHSREPSLVELDWEAWLSDPLNQRLAELDFEHAMEMFKRDNLLAARRKPTRGKARKVAPKYALVFSGDRAGATDSYATTTFNPDTYEFFN